MQQRKGVRGILISRQKFPAHYSHIDLTQHKVPDTLHKNVSYDSVLKVLDTECAHFLHN